MKKIVIFLLSVFSFLFFDCIVKAEVFYEGEYLSGEYIKKKNNGVTYYMTMQFVRDSKGDIVYCLEPFTKFEEGKAYTEYIGDLTNYSNLSAEQKRRLSLIIYYGYGYGNRLDNKWYAITQFMIWKELTPEGDVYFTGSLNGRKVTRYVEEMEEIYNDVNNHDIPPAFELGYEVPYGKELLIPEFPSYYKIDYTDYIMSMDNGLLIPKVENDGVINFSRNSNYYKESVAIFDSNESQDLIRPGNVENPLYTMRIKVQKGNIRLDIKGDDSVYTVESSLKDTCYEILDSSSERVDYVCTGEDEMVYETKDLVYGEYLVKQTNHGEGYLKDDKVYSVIIDDNNTSPNVVLYNYLLKNKIELTKYACKNNKCAFEENAEFEIIDKNKKSVDFIKTDKLGQASITLGYGTYIVKQVTGLDNYTFSEDFTERIKDEITSHKRDLFNNYIVEEEESKREVVVEEPLYIEEIEIPNTRTDSKIWLCFPLILYALKRIILN